MIPKRIFATRIKCYSLSRSLVCSLLCTTLMAGILDGRFFLGFAGIHGDKKTGIQQLEIAAEHGHYLRPFAKILLALAALREKKTEVARAHNLRSLSRNSPKTPCLRKSWPSSRFLLQRRDDNDPARLPR